MQVAFLLVSRVESELLDITEYLGIFYMSGLWFKLLYKALSLLQKTMFFHCKKQGSYPSGTQGVHVGVFSQTGRMRWYLDGCWDQLASWGKSLEAVQLVLTGSRWETETVVGFWSNKCKKKHKNVREALKKWRPRRLKMNIKEERKCFSQNYQKQMIMQLAASTLFGFLVPISRGKHFLTIWHCDIYIVYYTVYCILQYHNASATACTDTANWIRDKEVMQNMHVFLSWV